MIKKNILLVLFLLMISFSSKGQVDLWEESKIIPTYKIGPAEINPVFNWGTSNLSAYPYLQKEVLMDEKTDKSYTACWLENKYVKLLVLPEIGGRLHGAKDKTNNYDFFYWQNTIKPALIGMTGAWISGGIEWNFPHDNHRPSCYSPVPYRFSENEDGSKTIWVGEDEWLHRLKWIAGITLYPDRSYIKVNIKLYNPTFVAHSFQMWTTTAVHANEFYQMVYPVNIVSGHEKRTFYNWPVHEGTDLSWWKNVKNASSFFAEGRSEFFGGYDHDKDAGTIFTADKYLVPGKKVWTWGASPFGRIWEKILSEGQGPYIEPQLGAYSDNQPDYHWMKPGETRSIDQYFYPVRGIGIFKKANKDGALNLSFNKDTVIIGAYATTELNPGGIILTRNGNKVFEKYTTVSPDSPFLTKIILGEASNDSADFSLTLVDSDKQKLISYSPDVQETKSQLPEPPEIYGNPNEIKSLDKLWHAGEHAYRFKDTKRAIDYFNEIINRDSSHSRALLSLAEINIKLGEYRKALSHLENGKERLSDNPLYYFLKANAENELGDYGKAYANYYRSAHYNDYSSIAFQQLAKLSLKNNEYDKALMHIKKSLEQNTENPFLWCLKAIAERKNGNLEQASESAQYALKLDPLSGWALNELVLLNELQGKNEKEVRDELVHVLINDAHLYIELSLRYAEAGQYTDACSILEMYNKTNPNDSALTSYYLGYFFSQRNMNKEAGKWFDAGRNQSVNYVFPFRRNGLNVFREALDYNPKDGKAHYYLGLIYAALGETKSSMLDDALGHFRMSVDLDPDNPRAWRNLGLCLMHKKKDLNEAKLCYEKAFSLALDDSRILLELDEVKGKMRVSPEARLTFLKKHMPLVEKRDQLLKRVLMDLMNQTGEYEEALYYYRNHHFYNWEHRYAIHNGYMEACIGLANESKNPKKALKYYEMAGEYPENMDVAPREPDLRGFLYYPMAKLLEKLGNREKADSLLKITAQESTSKPSLATYYQSLALKDLGQKMKANQILSEFEAEAKSLIRGKAGGYGENNKELNETLGYYYLAKLCEAKNEPDKREEYMEKAKFVIPYIEREAIRLAQLAYARASQ